MHRRTFIGTLAGGLIAAPLAARAQQAGKMYQIGLLHVGLDHTPPSLDGLREGLRSLGYDVGTGSLPRASTVISGKNIRLDWRNLPDETTAGTTAREFVRERANLIVAFESQAARAATAATSEIPIVFLHVTDPVADGFVKSLAKPGGNLTGFGEFLEELFAKRIELFKELVPHLHRLLVLTAPDDPSSTRVLTEVQKTAGMLNIGLTERPVTDQASIEQIFRSLKPGDVDGVFVPSSTLITKFPSLIIRLATQQHLPVPGHRREWAQQGALFSYGANFRSVGQEAATYVDKILRGAKPDDLPVQQITRFELVINLKTVKALGLTIPPALLLRADQVIQ